MKKWIPLAVVACAAMVVAVPAMARKCDFLEIKLIAKAGSVCYPQYGLWGPISHQMIFQGERPSQITEGKTVVYMIKKHANIFDGFSTKSRISYEMTLNCRLLDPADGGTKRITITSEQEMRNKLRPGAISGMSFNPDLVSYSATQGVCSGKKQHAGVISWVLG